MITAFTSTSLRAYRNYQRIGDRQQIPRPRDLVGASVASTAWRSESSIGQMMEVVKEGVIMTMSSIRTTVERNATSIETQIIHTESLEDIVHEAGVQSAESGMSRTVEMIAIETTASGIEVETGTAMTATAEIVAPGDTKWTEFSRQFFWRRRAATATQASHFKPPVHVRPEHLGFSRCQTAAVCTCIKTIATAERDESKIVLAFCLC